MNTGNLVIELSTEPFKELWRLDVDVASLGQAFAEVFAQLARANLEYQSLVEISIGFVDILVTSVNLGRDRRGRVVFSMRAGGAMPEIGLLPFARVALDVATATLPSYRSRFS
ncbi:MAG: hypothetical protein WB780_06185, partial [Candidatus Acidiferrales bacterium]